MWKTRVCAGPAKGIVQVWVGVWVGVGGGHASIWGVQQQGGRWAPVPHCPPGSWMLDPPPGITLPLLHPWED